MPCTCQNVFNKLSSGNKKIGCNCKGGEFTEKNCIPNQESKPISDSSGKCMCNSPDSIKTCCQCCASGGQGNEAEDFGGFDTTQPGGEYDYGGSGGGGAGGGGGGGGGNKPPPSGKPPPPSSGKPKPPSSENKPGVGGDKTTESGNKPKNYMINISPESLEATCLCGDSCECNVCTCKPHTLYQVENIAEVENSCIELVKTKKKCNNSKALKFILKLNPEQMLMMCKVWCEKCKCELCVCRLEELFGCKKVVGVNLMCLLPLKKRRRGCVGLRTIEGRGGSGGGGGADSSGGGFGGNRPGGGGGGGGSNKPGGGKPKPGGEGADTVQPDKGSPIQLSPELSIEGGSIKSSESEIVETILHAPCRCKLGSTKPKSCKELGLVCKKPPVCVKLTCNSCSCAKPPCPPPKCVRPPCTPRRCPPTPPRCCPR